MNIKVDTFLHQYGMHYDTIDMDTERERLVCSMRDGLAGRPSSLMMIPSFLRVDQTLPVGVRVLVLDAGGTNFRVATATKRADGSIAIDDFRKYPMPGTTGAITADAFFEAIADSIAPILDTYEIDKAGFCFSYPVDILPSREGRIRDFSKEVMVNGAQGRLIGEGINKALAASGCKQPRFAVLNDTVATLLAGVLCSEMPYAGYIGYILGTGTNTCYLENCRNITKNADASQMAGQMAVNMESGVYNGFALGAFDLELDRESRNPGDHLMEKMMGGVYQGTALYKTVRRAAAEGLFSVGFHKRLSVLDSFGMAQIDEFCTASAGDGVLARLCGGNADDRQTLLGIIDTSFERSARMAAILFAAVTEQAAKGCTEDRPVRVIAEGTHFSKSILFKPKLDRYIKEYLNSKLGYYCEVGSVEEATLIGAACAALL